MFKKIFGFLFGGADKKSASANAGTLRDVEGFVEYVVKSLVDYPDEVSITTIDNQEGATIQIRCRKEDIGKIVGKHGKIIMAIRSLVSSAAGRQRKRISVDVLD
jgi:predicted RNA-binding protein YlqC (UPF0109 family)